jgi:hypothetical protein
MATENPPAGAGAFSDTTAPAVTLARPTRSTESTVVTFEAPMVAVIVTGVGPETAVVVTVKEMAEVAAAVVTEAGTDATEGFDDENVTRVPAGATPFNASVPVALYPPPTGDGVKVIEESAAAVTLSGADIVAPL